MSELGIFYPNVPSGGGDLTEATMTVIKSSAGGYAHIEACAIGIDSASNEAAITSIAVRGYSPTETTYKFILYKGKSQMKIYVEDTTGYEVNGNAELYDDEDALFIFATGDFTLIIP